MTREAQDRIFTPGFWGCLSAVAALMLSAILTAATVGSQRPSPTFCQGLLGAGFPAPFVCDASGESPLSGWGHIGWEDIDSPSIPGALVDLACYAIPLWIIALAATCAPVWIGRRKRR